MPPNPDARNVVVTGWGALSGLGQGVPAHWDALVAGHDAARPFQRAMPDNPELGFEGIAAWMTPYDSAGFARHFNHRLLTAMDPVAAHAVIAAFEALEDAQLIGHADIVAPAAVIIGCGGGGTGAIEEAYSRVFTKRTKSVHPLTIPRQMTSSPASQVSMVFGAKGPSFVIASACASSAHAIAEAAHMIRAGRIEIALVGGTEAPLTTGSMFAWQALRVMAQERCRPFSKDRDGLVLGEGAAMFVLESEAHAQRRGARIHARILGSGASSDAHHMTHPDGAGAVAAIADGLKDAGLSADTGFLISSHGTGTAINDKTEAAALRQVLGNSLEKSLVIATKSAHGHLLGAGGALEFLVGLLALKQRLAPAILNFTDRDTDCDLPLALENQSIKQQFLLSNSFAFGGTNSVLIGGLWET
jgi:nodulation protein E